MRPRPLRLTARPTQRLGNAPSVLANGDPALKSRDHRAWAEAVLKRARYTCEDPAHDPRKPRTGIKLHADHIRERRDAPELAFDLGNGLARCVGCHMRKTHRERAKRMAW